jgi:hypothetical protein
MVAPLAAGQAAIDVYNGPPASESGTMCLHVALAERSTVLHFCNRYVGIGAAGAMGYGLPEVATGASSDVANAMSMLDSVQFATLHVKSVRVSLDASRGLAEAMIVSAHAPKTVKPGERVTARLKLQLYREGTRTIRVRLHIPRDAHGTLAVTITGPNVSLAGLGAGSAAGLVEILTGSLGGPLPGSSGPPANLAQLRSQFAKIPSYDGLTAHLGRGQTRHVYRDPKMVITGTAAFSFKVKAPKARPVVPRPHPSVTVSGHSGSFSGGFFG